MLRRWLSLFLAVSLIGAAGLAEAQPAFQITSGGVIGCDTASYSISNSVQPVPLYQFVMPGAYAATQTLAPTLSATTAAWNWSSTVPLHFRALGTLTTNQGFDAPKTINMGINYGGTNASLSLVNGHALPGSLIDSPWRLDVYVLPYASATQGGGTSNMVGNVPRTGRLWAEFHYATQTLNGSSPLGPTAGTTPVYFASYVTTNIPLASQAQFNVEFRWSSAAQTNSINRHSACWKLGE